MRRLFANEQDQRSSPTGRHRTRMSVSWSKMRSVQPPSHPRPTPVLPPVPPRPAYLVRLTLDGLDAWTSNPVLQGLGDGADASLATKTAVAAPGRTGATWTPRRRDSSSGSAPEVARSERA